MLSNLYVDMVFAIGTAIFLISTLPQVIKLYHVTDSSAQSLCHNEMQLIAMSTLMAGYIIAAAPISCIVTGAQLVIRIHLIKLIRAKRPIKLKHKSDIVHYTKRFWRKLYGRIISSTSTKSTKRN